MKINLTEEQLNNIIDLCKYKSEKEYNAILKDLSVEYGISYIVLKRHYDGVIINYHKRGKSYATDYSKSELHLKRLNAIIENPSFETLPQIVDVAFDGDLDNKIDINEIKPNTIKPIVKWSITIIVLSILLSFLFLLF